MSDLFSQCTLANYENTVWFDVNGFKLVYYFPHLISESLSNDVLNAFHTLTTLYPPHSPGAREMTSWHQYLERKESLPPNTQSGVYRFTIYHQPGHKLDPPTFSKHFFSDRATHTFAAIGFRQSEPLRQLSELISIVFAGIDPKCPSTPLRILLFCGHPGAWRVCGGNILSLFELLSLWLSDWCEEDEGSLNILTLISSAFKV